MPGAPLPAPKTDLPDEYLWLNHWLEGKLNRARGRAGTGAPLFLNGDQPDARAHLGTKFVAERSATDEDVAAMEVLPSAPLRPASIIAGETDEQMPIARERSLEDTHRVQTSELELTVLRGGTLGDEPRSDVDGESAGSSDVSDTFFDLWYLSIGLSLILVC